MLRTKQKELLKQNKKYFLLLLKGFQLYKESLYFYSDNRGTKFCHVIQRIFGNFAINIFWHNVLLKKVPFQERIQSPVHVDFTYYWVC